MWPFHAHRHAHAGKAEDGYEIQIRSRRCHGRKHNVDDRSN